MIAENMPVILTWVASGYTLKSIYETLQRQGVLSCSYSNFEKCYYFFKKESGVSKPVVAAPVPKSVPQDLAVGKPVPEASVSCQPTAELKHSATENVASMDVVAVTEKQQPKGRSNKAIIYEQMPQIREWLSLGYNIPSIHKALKDEGVITCGLSNFRLSYYQALKAEPELSSTVFSANAASAGSAEAAGTVLNPDDDDHQPEVSDLDLGQKLLVMVWS